jgi:hypothetical protein
MPGKSSSCSLIAWCLVIGCVLAQTPDLPKKAEPNANPTSDVPVALELKAVTPVVQAGKSPEFTAELINKGPEPITVVLPGDGSESGWRTPIITWNPPMPRGGRCGNINRLKAQEVVTLRPDQRLRLGPWIGAPTLTEPGKHKVRLTLENRPQMKWKGVPLGEHDPAAMARVRASLPFKVVSNVVEIEVLEAKAP